jgi:hypothetical protein
MNAAEIADALGGGNGKKARRIGKNAFVAICPAHEDRTPSLSLSEIDGLTLWHCHAGCSQGEVRDALSARGLLPRAGEAVQRGKERPAAKPAQQKQPPDEARHVFAQAIWREAVEPRGTLAEKYLNGRSLALDDDLCGRVLRFHGRCPFGRDDAGRTIHAPALVVAFRPFRGDDEAKPPQAIHRIGLQPDGSKLAKLMLGPVGGAAVKLDADADVEQGLGVCEGIETGLAIRATGWRPVWALGSAGAIGAFAPVPGIEALTIFADHDENGVGTAAAKQCAKAWLAAGTEVFIRTPRDVGADWQDVS